MKRIYISALCLFACLNACANPGAKFSDLSASEQQAIKDACKPPPLAKRRGPYSTPMYYLMVKGYDYDGNEDVGPNDRCYSKMNGKVGPDWGSWKIDRNRPDWQEAMIKDWADLGLNNTHLNLFPIDGKLSLDADYTRAIQDFVALSAKYGLRVGVRLDSLDETKLWTMHPANPENRRKEYLGWVKEVATLLKGSTAYYVLGDELTLKQPAENLPKDAWTAPMYLDYFKEVSSAIKSADPSAKVCMFGASSGEWFNVLWLLENGYAQVGDGVAINHYDYSTVPKFFADRDRLAPGKMFLTNGVGYISAGTVTERYPQGDGYSPMPTEDAHAAAVAKTMFMWWDLGADTAPYYICLRNWVNDGKVYPRWFGFFGFQDFVIENDQLSVKHYPAWFAYQAVANTFYNRSEMKTVEVKSSEPISKLRAFEHAIPGGSELLLMVWNDDGAAKQTTITIASDKFKFPVRVSLADMQQWESLPSEVSNGSTTLQLTVGNVPQIIRLVQR
jgi:hypothetical protein